MAPPVDSSSLFVELWFNGLYCTLMLTTLHMIVTSNHLKGSRKAMQVVIIIVPYICSTIHMATVWLLAKNAINDNEAPNGPGVVNSIAHPIAWETGLSLTAFALNIFFADAIVIWRCWTVWGRRWIIVVLPILCSVTGAVIAGITIADQIISILAKQSLFAHQKAAQFVTFSTVFFSLSIATSLMTALLIAGRIISVQRETGMAGVDTRNSYSATIEIMVESAALYSVTLLAFIIILTRHHTPTSQFYSEHIHAQMAGIAPLLIIYRIAARHARPDSEWGNTGTMSTVQFAADPKYRSATQGSAFSHEEGETIAIGGSRGSSSSRSREKLPNSSV